MNLYRLVIYYSQSITITFSNFQSVAIPVTFPKFQSITVTLARIAFVIINYIVLQVGINLRGASGVYYFLFRLDC